jgi:hypothetical protein
MSGIGILIRRMRRVLVFSQPAGLVHMGFLKPRLLRCLGLRPRSIPGDDSSCFAVGADQDVRHGSDGYSTTARTREPRAQCPRAHTPVTHTTTPSRTGQSRRPARGCDGVQVRGALSKLCGVSRAAGPRPQAPKTPLPPNAREILMTPHGDLMPASACERATLRLASLRAARQSPTQAILCRSPAGSDYYPSFPPSHSSAFRMTNSLRRARLIRAIARVTKQST